MKKFLLMITIFLCMTPTVFGVDYIFNGETLPATSSYQDTYYGVETMQNILDDLEITYDDTTLLSYTYYANQALEFWRSNYDENTTPLNIIFTKSGNNSFYMIPSNGTFDDDLQYIYLRTNYSTSSGAIHSFVNWNYNADGVINSASYDNIQVIELYSSTYQITNTSVNYKKDSTNDYQDGDELYYKYLLSPIESFTTAAYVKGSGYGWYFLTNTIRFTEEPEIPSGDTGSGDTGNGDYTGQLTQIQGSLNNIENKIPTSGEIAEIVPSSGDIEQATQNGVLQGSTDYWGSSGDMSGDEQEELISGKVDELTEQISGDLAENEIFSVLKTYEDKLFGGFTGEQDFKISWDDISYAGGVIIPKGEVNFSQICRENEALGRVKTTINIILGFMLLYNCVIYLYNLLLATLGIDNPYLYEKPQDVTTTSYSVDMNTGKTTETKTTKRKDGITFTMRRNI